MSKIFNYIINYLTPLFKDNDIIVVVILILVIINVLNTILFRKNKCKIDNDICSNFTNNKIQEEIIYTNNKAINIDCTTYNNNKNELRKKYNEPPIDHDFKINVNSSICSTPIFNMRTYKDINFYFNFIIHNYNTSKIHNLVLCRDIHKWMNNPSLTDQDIPNELIPIYFCLKRENKIDVYEYLKIFVESTDDKIAFVQKGNDYCIIEKYINQLINNEIICDLLEGRTYVSYNLNTNVGVNEFLNNLLSLVLISEKNIGEHITIDIENYFENKKTYEYFFNTINEDTPIFNTSI